MHGRTSEYDITLGNGLVSHTNSIRRWLQLASLLLHCQSSYSPFNIRISLHRFEQSILDDVNHCPHERLLMLTAWTQLCFLFVPQLTHSRTSGTLQVLVTSLSAATMPTCNSSCPPRALLPTDAHRTQSFECVSGTAWAEPRTSS